MIGVLGGSFDPIHHGHLMVAQTALEALGLERVLFVPTGRQPLKQGHGASAAARAEMVRLAMHGVPAFALERCEVERAGPSYTVDTLRHLHAAWPGQRFMLLLGADAARDFGAWRDGEEVQRLSQLVVMTRAGGAPPVLPPGAVVLPVPRLDISATEIRARVAAGRPVRYWVPDPVAAFIASERLYLPNA